MQPFELPDFYVPWPARLNPNLDAARAYSKAWAQEMGILNASVGEDSAPTIWSEQAFDRHDYALFCAYIHPDVPIHELNLMTAWNVWAFYVDDYFLQIYKRPKDRDGAKKYLDRVLLFMPVDLNPSPEPTNPMEWGLTDLWSRTAETKSEAWRCRITESMKNLLAAFLWELDSMSEQRLANPIEYIEMRRQVGAALWSADLVEHAMLVEIPERISFTRPIQVLKNTFADAVHLRNDIFSYQREVLKDGELTNAILVLERFLRVDTQRAANLINDLLTSRLQQFEQTVLVELLPIFQEYALEPFEQANVLAYIRGLQDWQSGAHEWHVQTSRYLNHEEKASTMAGLPPSLLLLGVSAVRITPGTISLNRLKNYKHIPYKMAGPIQLPEFYMPFKPLMNPHLEMARRYTKTWADKMGFFDTLPNHPNIFIRDQHSFDAADVALFSAFAHPTANITQLNQYACWLVWGTYADDYFAEVYGHTHDLAGAKVFRIRLMEFMPLDSISPKPIPFTPVERGLADLWACATEKMSIDERYVFRKLVDDLVGSWLWELSNRIENRIPDLIDYIEMRRKTSAADFMLVFIRAMQGTGIPAEVYSSLSMQELNKITMDYAGLNNDIISYQKEIEFEGEISNGVLVIENFLGCDRIQAIEIVNNLTTARIKQFEHIVMKELPALFENFNLDVKAREQLLGYVKELQSFIYASLRWHITTGRYKEFELRRSPRTFTGRPMGLGTAATHISAILGGGGVNDLGAEQTEKLPKSVKNFGISHLLPPLARKKEEAQSD